MRSRKVKSISVHIRHCSLLALMLAVMLALPACTQPEPMTAWQHEVERYVVRYGDGNPAVLARLSPRATRRTFNHLGAEQGVLGPKRIDTNGILVGHQRIGDDLWFIYLVGVVENTGGMIDVNFDKPTVQDIQAVAFHHTTDGFQWVTGGPHVPATERYLAHQRERRRLGRLDHSAEDVSYTRFPRPRDRFEMERDDRDVIVRHVDSGATWSLQLHDTQTASHDDEADSTAHRSDP